MVSSERVQRTEVVGEQGTDGEVRAVVSCLWGAFEGTREEDHSGILKRCCPGRKDSGQGSLCCGSCGLRLGRLPREGSALRPSRGATLGHRAGRACPVLPPRACPVSHITPFSFTFPNTLAPSHHHRKPRTADDLTGFNSDS